MNRRVALFVLFLTTAWGAPVASPALLQEPGGGGRPERNQPGPWDQDVLVYRVKPDGETGKVATFERAGVPTIARMKDGRLIVAHQHFPEKDDVAFDKVAVRFSADNGKSWSEPAVIEVKGLPEGMRFPFDPTLVPLPDGKIRLYFTSTRGRIIADNPPAIYSAISDDGIRYTFEDGVRFGVEGKMIIDCAVVLHNGLFHLYVPDNGDAGSMPGKQSGEGVGYHAVSKDGLTFTREKEVRIEGRRRWLGNARSDGKTIVFYGTGEGMEKGGGFWMATSADGKEWKLVPNPPIRGGDPGAEMADGDLIVVITGGPRPGTPSANQKRRPPPDNRRDGR
ncbi:MAG: hypothetical protein A2Z34_11515 [Planctomycetes bacterium RBG_16_59_8]|nr:MAG: hypothetical protein A2Z34_11515 [Planctomycetes bacterium RBG_16_59_8]